jgi:hypothetical protein
MPSGVVAGFLPSTYGFRFRNRWPPGPARVLQLGPIRIPIGDIGRGLCGGMAFAARDRFERLEPAPLIDVPPSFGEALFKEIVDRQFDSFGRLLYAVPLRFWRAAMSSQAHRDRETALEAWPAIKAGIDAGRPPMVGLVRVPGWNPLSLGLGHQVVAYRYEETADKVSIWVYDPNYAAVDGVVMSFERRPDGTLTYSSDPDEPLVGLLALPFEPPRV